MWEIMMDKQREEFEKRTSKRLGYKFPEAYKIPAVYNDWCNWQECWQAAQAAMQPEIDRLKEQVHQYDKWLSDGIYWTNEEYDEQVRKPLADCQAKLKRYEDAFNEPEGYLITFYEDKKGGDRARITQCSLEPHLPDIPLGINSVEFRELISAIPLFTKPEGECDG
jgi:hypothetical protein